MNINFTCISKYKQKPYTTHHTQTLIFIILFLLSPLFVTAQTTHSSPNHLHTGGILLLAVLALLGYVVLYLLFKHCIQPWLRHSLERRANVGLDPSILETLPVFVYSNMMASKTLVECSICLGHFEGDEKVRLLPKCGHMFHVDCVDPWLKGHSTCPLCRADLVPQPDELHDVELGRVAGSGRGPGEVNADANNVVEAREEMRVTQSKKIWRWNSTGHVARNEKMKEKSTEVTKDNSTTRRELNRSTSCIIIKVGVKN